MYYSIFHFITMDSSSTECIAVYYSILQFLTIYYTALQHITAHSI